MQNIIVNYNIKSLAFFLTATLILTSCITIVSAKTVRIRGTTGSIKAGSMMLQDGFFSVSGASLRNITINHLRNDFIFFGKKLKLHFGSSSSR